MKKLITLFLFLVIFTTNSFAVKNHFYLQAGASVGHGILKSKQTENKTLGGGITTRYGYHFNHWDFILAGNIFTAEFEDTVLSESGNTYIGDLKLRTFSIGPIIRFITPYTIFNWKTYLQAGYHIALITVDPEDINYPAKHKLTYKAKGPTLGIGLLQDNVDYPLFLELNYTRLQAWKVYHVKVSKSGKLVEKVRFDGLDHTLEEHTIIISFGLEFL